VGPPPERISPKVIFWDRIPMIPRSAAVRKPPRRGMDFKWGRKRSGARSLWA
jgi:hypothetical protein